MPKKNKGTKGEAKGPQGKGKANGQAKANGKPEPKLPGSYARFKGDFSPNAEIRARSPKLLAFKTYGRLQDHLAKAVAEGKGLKEIAASLGVTPARINELVHILRIERVKAEKKAPTKKSMRKLGASLNDLLD